MVLDRKDKWQGSFTGCSNVTFSLFSWLMDPQAESWVKVSSDSVLGWLSSKYTLQSEQWLKG